MSQTLLVTGGSGMISRALVPRLTQAGFSVRTLDRLPGDGDHVQGDILDPRVLDQAIQGCSGILHLAAVARVQDAEKDPTRCWATNVEGTRAVVTAALSSRMSPWMVFLSSREVYGQSPVLPVEDDAPVCPLNQYGRSKAAAEACVRDGQASGLRAVCLRLTNVYGRADDYPQRVIPAFIRAALERRPLRVEGGARVFDFLHILDTVRAICLTVQALQSGQMFPGPLLLSSGRGISLAELAETIVALSGSTSCRLLREGPSGTVSGFVGNPVGASRLLGWRSKTRLAEGLKRLIEEIRLSNRCAA